MSGRRRPWLARNKLSVASWLATLASVAIVGYTFWPPGH